MAKRVKQLMSEFFPGLQSDQMVVGLVNVGVTVVACTLACNTTRTDAQIIASPPNTGNVNACGPVVHSLGTPPTLALVQLAADPSVPVQGYSVAYQYVTADNSAVYFRATSWTGAVPVGVGVRVIAIR